jgi:hypothetical protein
MRSLALVTLLSLLCTGCFPYAASPSAGPAPGTRVRAHLARPHDIRLTNVTANDVVRVEGEVVRMTPDTAVFSAWGLRAGSGYEFPATGETVRLERSAIARLEQRRFDVFRSAGLVAATLLTINLIDRAVGGLLGGGESSNGGNGGSSQ